MVLLLDADSLHSMINAVLGRCHWDVAPYLMTHLHVSWSSRSSYEKPTHTLSIHNVQCRQLQPFETHFLKCVTWLYLFYMLAILLLALGKHLQNSWITHLQHWWVQYKFNTAWQATCNTTLDLGYIPAILSKHTRRWWQIRYPYIGCTNNKCSRCVHVPRIKDRGVHHHHLLSSLTRAQKMTSTTSLLLSRTKQLAGRQRMT